MAEMTQQEYEQNKKDVYKTTGILAVVTVVEVLGSIDRKSVV